MMQLSFHDDNRLSLMVDDASEVALLLIALLLIAVQCCILLPFDGGKKALPPYDSEDE